MDTSTAVFVGVVAAAALAAFAAYRWRERARVRRVEGSVRDYLAARNGGPPPGLHIDCSEDRLWPVLADFIDRRTGARHRLQFGCPGPYSALSLLSEKVDAPAAGAAAHEAGSTGT